VTVEETYLVTVNDCVTRFCPACDEVRRVYIMVAKDAIITEVIVACCTCQRIIKRVSSGE